LVFYGLNNVDNSLNADGSTVAGKHNSVSQEKSTYSSFLYELFGNYNFTLKDKHNFETTAGISLSKNSGNVAGASRQDVPFNSWEFADFTAATGTTSNNNADGLRGYYYQFEARRASGFARVNYDYDNRYLASFTVRRDGSYAFGTDNKFANFYSGSAGWVVSNEKFFKSDFINYLKVRGSMGSVGNDNNIDPKAVLATIQTDYLNSLYASGNSIGYTFGNVFYNGATLGTASNTSLRWEKQIQNNIGFEMAFLKNKFSLAFDYYTKRTEGLLFVPAVSAYLGTIPPPVANIGSTKTSGVDITLGYTEKISDKLSINSSLVFSSAKNMVTKTSEEGAVITGGNFFNGQNQTVTVFATGYAPSAFFGYQAIGIFQTSEEVASSPTQNGAQPGDIKFADINNDGVINDKDRTVIGNPFPDFTMGWNLGINLGRFDFSAFTYASSGNDVYRAFERNDNYTNKYQDVLDRWTGPGSTNDPRNPRYSFTDPNNNSRVSSRFVEDGSFIKIKNLQLGYTIPVSKDGKGFKSFRVFGQVKNAFVFTKYRGFDPEIAGGGLLDTGIDRGAFPQARNYVLGIDVKF
jgi:TonB-linked SusC/RagA family outer membrane protein